MNKILFFSSSSCGPCRLAKKYISTNLYNENLNIENIDIEQMENIELLKKHEILGVPTFVIIDEQGSTINKKVGFKSLNDDLKEFLLQKEEK